MGYSVSSSWRGSSLSEHFCESQPTDKGDCHFISAADTDGLNDLGKQLLIEAVQGFLELFQQLFQPCQFLYHIGNARGEFTLALPLQPAQLIVDLLHLGFVDLVFEISLCMELLLSLIHI